MRAIWKGSLSFGLVNIPVQMFTASREKEVSFILLHKKDHSHIHYARICSAEDKEVPWSDIEKGYEIEKGNYVVLDTKDFQKANLKKTQTIEILHFIQESEIDTIYYAKPYFLEPGKGAQKAYCLFRDALKRSKKVGLAKYVLHNKEHISVVKLHGDMLIVNELRYQNELLHEDELRIPHAKSTAQEVAMAVQLIDQLTKPFTPKKYKNTYVEELKRIIQQKVKGAVAPASSEKPKPTKVHDIMDLLEASLQETKKSKRRRR